MQIECHNIRPPACRLQLLQRKIKEQPVVRLELNCPILFQDFIIPRQKLPGRQTPLRMSVLRPGIGKIQIDPVYLAPVKNIA